MKTITGLTYLNKKENKNHAIFNFDNSTFYDTLDECFYPENKGIDFQSKRVLKEIIRNNPNKFVNCTIIKQF